MNLRLWIVELLPLSSRGCLSAVAMQGNVGHVLTAPWIAAVGYASFAMTRENASYRM